MLRWSSTSSSIPIENAVTAAVSGGDMSSAIHQDETSSSSPEPQEPVTGALMVDSDEEAASTTTQQALPTSSSAATSSGGGDKKTRGDKRKRSREEDSAGEDHAQEDDDEDVRPPFWRPQNVQSTTEFTHIIMKYANKRESGCKKAEYSEITVDDHGNRWRLIVYVNGNGRASNHHLSLFLQVADADDLPFGWKKSVSYVLTLEHPNGSTYSYAKRNPDKTFKLCPKAIDWGWSQFITSDRIQQEGFVQNDTLVVRASVTVKSSSVSIDQEDAELYLKCAVEEGDADAVELCLENGASVNCQFKDDLYTPLHTACSSGSSTGSMEVLEILLERGADCNACNKWRETPLLIAANNGHRLGVASLLKHGADPSLCSEAGWSALTFAAHKGYDDIVGLLLRAGAPVNSRVTEDLSTPLHKACAGSKPGHLASVKLLLENMADVHALNKWRETPLLTAANHGQAGAVQALLSHGADPCKCTDTGWSPLSIAAYKGHDDVVRLLLEEGAPTEEDDPTLSALLQAATKGLPDTVELLLRHGADHTVTTKKGDTALSILVEQNLIDAAVEMVTVYNASIPRCSKDRKKVQRARLLINLRMKQLEREGQDHIQDDSDNDGEDEATLALHVANGLPAQPTKSKKKKNKQKMTAEEKARAAEEALLEELAKEEEEAKREEAEANKKQLKKRKKKEKERQLKMKEEQERKEREEAEEREKERLRKEKEEEERRERERKLKEEREMKELIKREKEKRKVKERKERQKQRDEKLLQSAPQSPKRSSVPPPKAGKTKRNAVAPVQPYMQNPGLGLAPKLTNGIESDAPRRWETTKITRQSNVPSKVSDGENKKPGLPDQSFVTHYAEHIPPLDIGKAPSGLTRAGDILAELNTPLRGYTNGLHLPQVSPDVENPRVWLYRKGQLTELLHRAQEVQRVLPDTAVKRVLSHWITRAHHGTDTFLDPIIPSWSNAEKGVEFFQRQFISESRRVMTPDLVPNMETVKDAGSAFAALCQEVASKVVRFAQDLKSKSNMEFTDIGVGMTVMSPQNGTDFFLLSLARHTITVPVSAYDVFRKSYKGVPERFLSAVFDSCMFYESQKLLVQGTSLDSRLPISVKASLSLELGVTKELNGDVVGSSAFGTFYGAIEIVDCPFGGKKPFTIEHTVSILGSGGSFCVMLPYESMVASLYTSRIFELVADANRLQLHACFFVFVTNNSLHDPSRELSMGELRMLDSRLESADVVSIVLKRDEFLMMGFDLHEVARPSQCDCLVFVLQSEMSKSTNPISEAMLAASLSSMRNPVFHDSPTQVASSILGEPLQPDFSLASSPTPSSYFLGSQNDGFGPAPFCDGPSSPTKFLSDHIDSSNTDAISSGLPFEIPRANARRGRLFDLVENDAEEDNAVDLVAGMLNNLDVGFFQNTSIGASDVDIEAISLMGINGTSSSTKFTGGPSVSSRSNPFG